MNSFAPGSKSRRNGDYRLKNSFSCAVSFFVPVVIRGKWNIWVLNFPEYQEAPDLVEAYKLLSKGNCCTFFTASLADDPKLSSPKK
jgi:hypothetical protein